MLPMLRSARRPARLAPRRQSFHSINHCIAGRADSGIEAELWASITLSAGLVSALTRVFHRSDCFWLPMEGMLFALIRR